jgi:periplasmic mercuric ion binding protein
MWKFSKVLLVLAIAVLAGGSLNAAPDVEETVSFSVEKMTCATCPIAVRKAMERVEGVKEVAVDFDSKTAVVTYDAGMTDATAIGAASTDVGFPATVRDGHDE